jgi:hypothetical protein
MRSCFQCEGMSVYDHGLDVRSRYSDLRDHLMKGVPLVMEWRLPAWIFRADPASLDDSVMEAYQVFHDCGKPFCRTVDDTGRQHFPNHANESKRRWLECTDGSEWSAGVAELIGMDMDAHLLRASSVDEFRKRPQALALLLTALAEIHSNSAMFGGIDSVGFKIKYKALDRFGGRIVGSV